MIVKCLFSSLNEINDEKMRVHVHKYGNLDEISFVAGWQYIVYGVFTRDNVPWYLLCDSPDVAFPIPECSCFFELVDKRIPSGWSFNIKDNGFSVLPSGWQQNTRFLEHLIDGDLGAVEYFSSLRQEQMELYDSSDEFHDAVDVILDGVNIAQRRFEKSLWFCRCCGYKHDERPWGRHGETPDLSVCYCCGIQSGIEDVTLEDVRNYRNAWVANGVKWAVVEKRPDDWDIVQQFLNIPYRFR